MRKPNELTSRCICGCGEPAVYAAKHVNCKPRAGITADDYDIVDLGYLTPCWIWRGRSGRGRGKVLYFKARIGGTQTYVHRASHIQFKGPIPEGLVVDHRCDNTHCVNPDHLKAVTTGENTGRATRKLTAPQVREIRVSVEDRAALANRYGVCERVVYDVQRGVRYKDVH